MEDALGRSRTLAQEEGVLPVLAPAAHHVGAGTNRIEQPRDVGRIVLQVAVHGDQDVAPRPVEAGLQRQGLPEVASQLDDDELRRKQMLDQLNQLVSREPAKVAGLLRRWMRTEA